MASNANPKTAEQLYEEATSAYAQAERVGGELQSQVERKVAECNALAAGGPGGSEFIALEYAGEKDETGRWRFSVTGKLQRAEIEVNPKPGRISFAMKDAEGQPKGAKQLLKIENPSSDLPEYLAASLIESVVEATEFKA